MGCYEGVFYGTEAYGGSWVMRSKPKAKKRKPTDATMRNVRAANRRIDKIKDRLDWSLPRITQWCTSLTIELQLLSSRVRKLEDKK